MDSSTATPATVTACPVCEAISTEPYLSRPADDAVLPLRRCRACGFIFATARPSDGERHRSEYHTRRTKLIDTVSATVNACRMLEFWASRLKWKPGMRLLDLGCAEGRLVEIARAMGFDVQGIDVTNFHAQQWRDRALRAEVATVETLSGRGEPPFDAIVSREVIEHVSSPRELLRSCANILKPGGVCIVETGDAQSIQARLQRRSWSYWIPSEGPGAHISFLTVKNARELGKRAGLQLVEAVPAFAYRTRATYAHQLGESSPGLKSTLQYLLHRHVLHGTRCYRFQKPLAGPDAGG